MPTALITSHFQQDASSDQKEQSFEVNQGEILFDELEKQNKILPHGCLSGSCGSCRILVTKGHENLSEPRIIEKDTLESLKADFQSKGQGTLLSKGELRLSCRARVNGDITFEPI